MILVIIFAVVVITAIIMFVRKLALIRTTRP